MNLYGTSGVGKASLAIAVGHSLLSQGLHSKEDLTSKFLGVSRQPNINVQHASTADSYYSLGNTQYKVDDFTSALESHQRALGIRLKLFGEKHASTADSYYSLGNTQYKMNDFASALEYHQRALGIRLKLFGEKHASTADSYSSLGYTQYKMNDFTSALKSHLRALGIHLKLFGKKHASTADSHSSLGITRSEMSDFKDQPGSGNKWLHGYFNPSQLFIPTVTHKKVSVLSPKFSLCSNHSRGDWL